MTTTLLSHMINPEVMGDMISAELENKLVATGLFNVNKELVGKPGNTITVPCYIYVGPAEDLAENTEGEISLMQTADMEYTVKKAVKNIVLTDEAMLSGYGDPVGQAVQQLRLSIQDKIDNDAMELLVDIPTVTGGGLDGTKAGLHYEQAAGPFTYETILEAMELLKFEEMPSDLYLVVSRGIARTIKGDARFVDRYTAYGDTLLQTGVIGTLGGCKVIISNKIPDAPLTQPRAFIVPQGAITAFLKREVFLETQRELLFKRTIFGVDQHYTVAIEDYTKVCAITVGAVPAP